MLKKILYADLVMGGVTGVAGLCFYKVLAAFLGLPQQGFAVVCAVTLLYALVALKLVLQRTPSPLLLWGLVFGNWVWTAVSVVLLWYWFAAATVFGVVFLVLQVVVVGGLAYMEGRFLS